MLPSITMDKLSENDPPESEFWCNLCKVSCVSAGTLHAHFMGMKHKRVEEALKNHGDEASLEQAIKRKVPDATNASEVVDEEQKPAETLEALLNNCQATEPAVGLEHIYEYHPANGGCYIYECRLCNCTVGLSNIFMHIFGSKHRIAYLSKYHPIMGIPSNYHLKKNSKNLKLRNCCEAIEKTFGRKQINILEGDYAPRKSSEGPLPPPSINYRPNGIMQKMDFTTDEFQAFDLPVTPKPARPDRELSFRELKAKYGATMKDLKVGASSASTDTGDKREEQKESKDTNEEGNASDRDVVSMDLSDSDSDELCNKELFDFLENFKILNESDAQFVVKAIEVFGSALIKYKKQEIEQIQMRLSEKGVVKLSGQSAGHSAVSTNKQPGVGPEPKISYSSGPMLYNIPGAKANPVQSNPSTNAQSNTVCVAEPKLSNPSLKTQQDSATKGSLNQQSAPQNVKDPAIPSNEKASGSTAAVGVKSVKPVFPNNATTARFFDSIKNMEVSEVIAKMNRLAATNPAFKGVDVPTLIQHLRETGKLKS
uniref:C2H2-type domain-containing protein n=1 Tax=Leptobrachium leishanense TaxID=445787 RepID=A0A8C5Q114_9ANUR